MSRGGFARQERGHQEAGGLLIGGTDRRRPRPKNRAQQALPYRGKQKTQSDKNGVVVNAKTKRGGDLRQSSAGKIHAQKLVDTEPIRSPPGTILEKAPGF